ncbi:DUF6702 family protein [Olleya sp. R77988]|uniref:DUF6702 family protein n=1 Tax=Olleya sp. R77988 TaxID=3093875 RepID=UPI0037CAADA0
MKTLKYSLLISIFSLFAFTSAHKYYVSITQLEFVKDTQSVQIISRIFVDDFERLLRKRYDETIVLSDSINESKIDGYIEKYLLDKIEIKIDNQTKVISFIGKKYEEDIMHCYLEIENVPSITSFEIQNKVLYDMFEEQKNIVRTKINGKNKTFVLIPENDKGLLNF